MMQPKKKRKDLEPPEHVKKLYGEGQKKLLAELLRDVNFDKATVRFKHELCYQPQLSNLASSIPMPPVDRILQPRGENRGQARQEDCEGRCRLVLRG